MTEVIYVHQSLTTLIQVKNESCPKDHYASYSDSFSEAINFRYLRFHLIKGLWNLGSQKSCTLGRS